MGRFSIIEGVGIRLVGIGLALGAIFGQKQFNAAVQGIEILQQLVLAQINRANGFDFLRIGETHALWPFLLNFSVPVPAKAQPPRVGLGHNPAPFGIVRPHRPSRISPAEFEQGKIGKVGQDPLYSQKPPLVAGQTRRRLATIRSLVFAIARENRLFPCSER